MTDQDSESVLLLALRTLRFATDHPYAATGICGAAIGSVVTYAIMTGPARTRVQSVFTPRVYEFALTREDLQHMLMDPSVEIRYETAEIAVIVTSEKRARLKALPIVEQ